MCEASSLGPLVGHLAWYSETRYDNNSTIKVDTGSSGQRSNSATTPRAFLHERGLGCV